MGQLSAGVTLSLVFVQKLRPASERLNLTNLGHCPLLRIELRQLIIDNALVFYNDLANFDIPLSLFQHILRIFGHLQKNISTILWPIGKNLLRLVGQHGRGIEGVIGLHHLTGGHKILVA